MIDLEKSLIKWLYTTYGFYEKMYIHINNFNIKNDYIHCQDVFDFIKIN
jgi:hypothetical protein